MTVYGVLAPWVLVAACTNDDGGPRLGRATPERAAIGASVALTGDQFCGETPDCTAVAAAVEIGIDAPIVQAQILAYAASTATIQIPAIAAPGDTEIVLTVNGRSSNALPFVVLVP